MLKPKIDIRREKQKNKHVCGTEPSVFHGKHKYNIHVTYIVTSCLRANSDHLTKFTNWALINS